MSQNVADWTATGTCLQLRALVHRKLDCSLKRLWAGDNDAPDPIRARAAGREFGSLVDPRREGSGSRNSDRSAISLTPFASRV